MQIATPIAVPSGQTAPLPRHTKHTSETLKKIGDREPIFVLRAGDQLAATAVRLWAELLASQAPQADFPAQKYADARDCACAMEAWAREHGSKLPD